MESEIDFDGWRAAARALRAEGVAPEAVVWTVERELFRFRIAQNNPCHPGRSEARIRDRSRARRIRRSRIRATRSSGMTTKISKLPAERLEFTVPADFVDLAKTVILHRSPERLALLYRILHRLEHQPRLLDNPADADVAKARDMAKGVARAIHKMHAFVRFRLVEDAAPETYVAWFEPAHRVTEAAAPFFARRFSNMNWSILTPDACVHWDGRALTTSPGADPADAPSEDALEEMWRTYYASIFNPARLKAGDDETGDAQTLLAEPAGGRAHSGPDRESPKPDRNHGRTPRPPAVGPGAQGGAPAHARDGSFGESAPGQPLEEVAAGIQVCRRCDLWRDATQGVPGRGCRRRRG